VVHPEIIDPDEFEENENEDQREDKPGDPNALELPHVAQPNDNIYMNEVNVPYNKSPSRQNAGTHSPAVTNGLTSFHDLVDETWEALEHVSTFEDKKMFGKVVEVTSCDEMVLFTNLVRKKFNFVVFDVFAQRCLYFC
jgi:hypothetical protein